MSEKLRISITVRKANNIKPFKHEIICSEEFETSEDLFEEAHAILDQFEEDTRGKKRATDINFGLSSSED
jgi:hypothetical protein